MHEANFTEEIVKAILEGLKSHPSRKPKSIKVKVGEMLHLQEDSVRMHYELLVKNTPLEGVVLHLEEVPVVLCCKDCGWTDHPLDHHLLMCTECGSSQVEVLSGKQIQIDSIELE